MRVFYHVLILNIEKWEGREFIWVWADFKSWFGLDFSYLLQTEIQSLSNLNFGCFKLISMNSVLNFCSFFFFFEYKFGNLIKNLSFSILENLKKN